MQLFGAMGVLTVLPIICAVVVEAGWRENLTLKDSSDIVLPTIAFTFWGVSDSILQAYTCVLRLVYTCFLTVSLTVRHRKHNVIIHALASAACSFSW